MKKFMVVTVKDGKQKAEFFNMYDSARAYGLAMGAMGADVQIYKFYADTKIYEIMEVL
jgi:hypothetical protein